MPEQEASKTQQAPKNNPSPRGFGAPRGRGGAGAPKKGAPQKRRRPKSEYGRQLEEKQKAKRNYGLSEKQFSGYVKKATEKKGVDPKTYLYELLESRLDSFVYRTGLSLFSRRLARQIVVHGHVTVNGRKVNVPSYAVRPGDKIAIREGSSKGPLFQKGQKSVDENKIMPPSWIRFDYKALSGELHDVPQINKNEMQADFTSVLEFYSR